MSLLNDLSSIKRYWSREVHHSYSLKLHTLNFNFIPLTELLMNFLTLDCVQPPMSKEQIVPFFIVVP